jgi:hypothetical protein
MLQKEFDSLKVKTYSGIWKENVTTADWPNKYASIQTKKNYFQNKLNAVELSDADKAMFAQFLKDLDEFAAKGKHYYDVQIRLNQAKNGLTALLKNSKINYGLDGAFSQARKDAVLWAKSPKEADGALREICGKVWRDATKAERKAIFDYTCGSGGFNRPLRGYDGSWGNFKGIGKVSLNAEGRASAIKEMTRLIDKSSYDIDVWLQRGVKKSEGQQVFLVFQKKNCVI